MNRADKVTLAIALTIALLLIHEKLKEGYWFKPSDLTVPRITHEKIILVLIIMLIVVLVMRFLLAVMHPRRLDFFLESIREIDYVDILLAKNYPIIQAQEKIRDFFLSRDYDYLILTSDDVKIPYLAPAMIMANVELYGYDIVTGWSLIRPNSRYANINREPPYGIDRYLGRPVWLNQYRFLTLSEIIDHILNGEYVIPVWFVGWSLTAMSREVVEKWTPRGWYFQYGEPGHEVYQGRRGFWASSDLWYSYQMWKEGYEKYADLTVYIPHYPPRPQPLLVGKEPPELEFIAKKKTIIGK